MPDPQERPPRGQRKREKTRSQLLAAGLAVLAEKGEALTVSDVVAAAEVSNGTFYNYFADRDELVDALGAQLVLTLAAAAASETTAADPALRFATVTGRVLDRAAEDPTWGRVVLRLVDLRANVHADVVRYLREDLAAGFAAGRFEAAPDEATLDQAIGLITMAIRRIVAGGATPDYRQRVLERALGALGIPAAERRRLAEQALAS